MKGGIISRVSGILKTVKVRFLVALLGNAVRAVASFSAGILVARGLGAENFGVLTFLSATFAALRPLLDLGASTAFYTFISRGGEIRPYLRLYFLWLSLQLVTMVALIAILLPEPAYQAIWIGQSRGLVLLGFLSAFFQLQVWSTLTQIGESQRETLLVQSANVLVAMVHVGVVALLLGGHLLSVRLMLAVLLVEYLVAVALASYVLYRRHAPAVVIRPAPVCSATIRREFISYCRPLVLSALAGAAFQFGDRWMLQRFSGAINQGLYQAAYQIAAISLFATTSIMQVFWKELSDAHARGDHEKLRRLYYRVSRAVVFAGAVISGLMLPWSEEIAQAMLGPEFKGTGPILALLLIYPIHQALGQVAGTLAFATESTAIYSKVTITFTAISLILSYLLLAPQSGVLLPGLGLGAFGLACKMVGLNIISVNVMDWLLARQQKWKFEWMYQFFTIGISLVLGFTAKWVATSVWFPVEVTVKGLVAPLGLSAIIYVIAQLGFIFFCPSIIGQTKIELGAYWTVLAQRWKP